MGGRGLFSLPQVGRNRVLVMFPLLVGASHRVTRRNKWENGKSRKPTGIWDTTQIPGYLAGLSEAGIFCLRLWTPTCITTASTSSFFWLITSNISSSPTESTRHHPAEGAPFLPRSYTRASHWLLSSQDRAALESGANPWTNHASLATGHKTGLLIHRNHRHFSLKGWEVAREFRDC